MKKENKINYHTHTYRCGHAGNFSDKDYVLAARESNIMTIGFSDHVPFTEFELPNKKSRMLISEVDSYIESINNLKKHYSDMTILIGFEAEYDPAKRKFLAYLRDKVDYLILGQHFLQDGINSINNCNNTNYPLEYAKYLCDGMDSGLFDIIAHPDIFMVQLNRIVGNMNKEEFLDNAEKASLIICEKAIELDIPLELNLSGLYKGNEYPNPLFWKIASKMHNKVIVGADAHNPEQLKTMDIDFDRAIKKIGNLPLNIIDDDYNPITERYNNKVLQENLVKTRNSLPYDEYIKLQSFNIENDFGYRHIKKK